MFGYQNLDITIDPTYINNNKRQSAVKSAKNNKAVGQNGKPAELLTLIGGDNI